LLSPSAFASMGSGAVAAMPAPAPRARRKSRRPTGVLDSGFIVVSSEVGSRPGLPPLSCGERKRRSLDVHEAASKRTDLAVEAGRPGVLEVGEETPDPRRQMLLENPLVGTWRSAEALRRQGGHNLA